MMVNHTGEIINSKSMTGKQKRKQSMSSMSSHEESSKSTKSSSVGRSTLSTANQEAQKNDVKSAKTVYRLKMVILTFFTLTATGVTAAFLVYRHYNRQTQEKEFKNRFQEDATNMLASLSMSIDSTLAATDAFAVSMLAYAKATNQTYPFVTIGDFPVQAGKLLKNTRAKFVTTYQIVEESQRLEWEQYASTHNGWVDESVEIQSRDRSYNGPNITDQYLEDNYLGNYDFIHGYDDIEEHFGTENDKGGASHEGPYLPSWQCTPVIPVYPIYNWYVLYMLLFFLLLPSSLLALGCACGCSCIPVVQSGRSYCCIESSFPSYSFNINISHALYLSQIK
jgi:hypothetical protein